jgi:hypothetical protein
MNTSYESPYCAICKPRRLTNGIWECLSDTPHLCPNSLDFGFSHHLCRHPEAEKLNRDMRENEGKAGRD